jgi:hypothetical protein
MQESDSLHARNQSEKLRLREERNLLRKCETLVLHESSTASQEERALAGSKIRTLFLESLEKRTGSTDGAQVAPLSVSPTYVLSQPSQADDYVVASVHHEGILGETEEGAQQSHSASRVSTTTPRMSAALQSLHRIKMVTPKVIYSFSSWYVLEICHF